MVKRPVWVSNKTCRTARHVGIEAAAKVNEPRAAVRPVNTMRSFWPSAPHDGQTILGYPSCKSGRAVRVAVALVPARAVQVETASPSARPVMVAASSHSIRLVCGGPQYWRRDAQRANIWRVLRGTSHGLPVNSVQEFQQRRSASGAGHAEQQDDLGERVNFPDSPSVRERRLRL